MENKKIICVDLRSSAAEIVFSIILSNLLALDSGSLGRDLAHFAHGRFGIGTVKNSRPCDDPITPGADDVGQVFPMDAAIDFDGKRQPLLTAEGIELAHLLQHVGDQLLSPETGIDAHEEHVVGHFQDVLQDGDGSGGIEDDTGHGAGGFPCMLPRANYFWGKTWNEEPSSEGEGLGPAELAKRFYYDGLVMDRRTLRHLIDMMGHTQVLVGSDFPAMPREQPCGRTLRSLDLAPDELEDITWHNTFRFLGVDAPQLVGEGAGTATERVTQ